MTVIGKNSLLKRITAFVLALLMVFTLMPWENYVTFAEEETGNEENVSVQYSFVVTDAEGEALKNASVEIYGVDSLVVGSGSTNNEGTVTISGVTGGVTYSVSASTYAKATGCLDENATTVNVSMQKLRGMKGTVKDNVNSPISSATVQLWQNDEKKNETLTDIDGEFFFDIVEDGDYVINVQSVNYKTKFADVTDFTATEGDYTTCDAIILEQKDIVGINISHDGDGTSIEEGETLTLSMAFNPETEITGYTLKFSSSDEKVATVTDTGVVTGVSAGNATITVELIHDNYICSPAATIDITVTEYVNKATLTGTVSLPSGTLNCAGATVYLLASDIDGVTNDLSTAVASTTTDANGGYSFTKLAIGTSYKLLVMDDNYTSELSDVIDITGNDGDTVEKNLTAKRIVKLEFVSQNQDLHINEEVVQNKLDITPADVTAEVLQLKYKSSAENIAMVDASTGALTLAGEEGNATVTVEIQNTDYTASSDSVLTYAINVTKIPNPDIKFNAEALRAEEVKKYFSITGFDSSVNYTGTETVTYTSSDTDIAEIDEDGFITMKTLGSVTIKATVPADGGYAETICSYNLTVLQTPQTDLLWDTVELNGDSEQTKTVKYGEISEFTVGVMGVIDNLNGTYSSGDEDVATIDETGKVTIVGQGETTIKYTSPVNDTRYEEKTLTFKLVVSKGTQPLSWDNEEAVNGMIEKTFGDGKFIVGIVVGEDTGDKTKLSGLYSSGDTNVAVVDPATGEVTVISAGETTITYTSTDENGNYDVKKLTYKIIVKKAQQNDFKWGNGYEDGKQIEITYEPSKTIIDVKATGACAETESVTYSSTNTDVATVDSTTGVVTIEKVGEVTIEATATVPKDGNYTTKTIKYSINVTPSQHTDFAWQGGNPETIYLTYEDVPETYVAAGQCENAEVTYSSTNTDVATVDSTTGVVSIKKAGEVTIEATAAATGNYKATTISYKIVIAKKAQTMSFAQDIYTLVNGDNKFVSPVISMQSEISTAEKIVYSVPKENDIATIDSKSGKLSFTLQPGTVTVTAVKPEDDQYLGTTAMYTITVQEWDPLKDGDSSQYYMIKGTQKNPESTWFNYYSEKDTLQLVAKAGYALYKSNTAPVPSSTWTSAVSVSNVHEGTDNTITFYLKDAENGFVSKQYTVNNIKVDSILPTAAISVDEVTIWDKLLSFFTFNLAGQKTPELKITSNDTLSGVKEVYYYISNTVEPLASNGVIDVNTLEKEADWKEYQTVVDLSDEKLTKNVIYAKVVDNAGNIGYTATNGLIFDATKPVITPTFVTKNVNGYYNKDVEIQLDVADAEPYSGIKKITYIVENAGKVTDSGTLYEFISGEKDNPSHNELLSKWNSADYKKNVIVDAKKNNSDNVKVTFTVTDNAGNISESVVNLKIDVTAPEIRVEYDNNKGDESFKDGVYFNTDRTATISVSERHFNKDKFVLAITNTDGVIPKLSDWKMTSEGSGNGDDITYTATVSFSEDGDYTLDISYTDEAGNKNDKVDYGKSQTPTTFTIDKTNPTISISYDNNEVLNKNYYKADRTATIVIEEHNFDASRVKVLITAKDGKKSVEVPVISKWRNSGDKHTATITYDADACYTFDIEYWDKAGNSIANVKKQTFYVDKTIPTASIAIDDVTIWEKILSFFTFDLAGQDTPELKITSDDELSGVEAVYYYISNTTEPLESKGLIDVNALEKEAEWKTYKDVVDLGDEEVTKNVIYAKVVDKAGNSTYVATNGLIFDGTKPVVTPTIVTKDVNGYYNKNVEINLDVVDAEPYSGVNEITYVVENDGKVTDSGTLYTFEPKKEDNPKHSELINEWNSDDYDKNVIVKAADNNSDDVKVTFTVTDNAGNTTESVVELKIDITHPIINVVYDNNNGDATFADGVYFNADRTATITVSERHFNKDEFVLTITNSDGTIPELSKWTKTSKGTGNGDDITYTATVYFGADGDYTLDISYVDEAGNKCAEVNYGESQAPTAFTVDKTIPTISVSYDNNDALNENYFKADRTATIVIQEHNFDASRVNAIITATDNVEPIAAPVISGWSTSGDTHTATISYSSDALYSFDIEYLDKAGNSIVDVAEQSFYVDKTMPQVSITEIVDQSANNAEKIGFVITATDTNFDVFTPVITAVIQTENGITTTEVEAGSISEITNGQIYTVDNLDADGIYSITCTVIDKAGNAYTEVNLQREDGSTYVENRAGEDTLLMFSVNRDGSTFAVDDSTQSVLDNEYIQNIENDIVIYEVNTNELVSYALTLNGEELTEGTDYTVTSTGGDGTWMRYTYTVNKELFEAEGEYILVVSSTDGAENDAFSDVKNANISFIVDRTAPIVTVTGMESNRSYQTEAQIVTVMPTDDGGIIESLIINFVDRDGNITDEIFAKSGDELRELLETNGGIITFELSDVTRENIQIICSDKAYDANGQSNTFNQIYENITVSASAVAIFFAGNTIYYILGGVAAVATLAVGVFLKKRKSSKAKNA